MSDEQNRDRKTSLGKIVPSGMLIGAGIGLLIGLLAGSIAIGVAVGAGIGMLVCVFFVRKKPKDDRS